MKHLGALLLPFFIILAGGMAVGSIHNAQMREAMPGIFTVMGAIFILFSLLELLMGLLLWRYYEKLPPFGWFAAVMASVFVIVIGAINMLTTLQAEGTLAGWLFHEYLGPIAGVAQLIKLLIERR